MFYGFPRWHSDKEIYLSVQEMQETWVQFLGQKNPWSRKWQPGPVFLPGKFHGQGNLVGYSPWGRKEWDTTKHACTHSLFFTSILYLVLLRY